MNFFYLPGFSQWKSKKEWGRIMRLTFSLIVGLVFTVNASSYSQITRLDIRLSQSSVGELISYVEENSEFVFLYRNDELDMEKQVTVDLENASIQQILDAGFGEQNINWEVHDRQIILRKGAAMNVSRQQQRVVTGVVTDQNGLPLPGVTVVVPETTTGTITGSNGEFTLNIPANTESLQFSFVGMRLQEIP